MATSPNYAWAEPDNSSLVKNGASDIRTLGDAIDTSVWNIGYGQAGKNKLINADFFINQRNFTSTTTDGTFGFDRWFMQTFDGTATYSAQNFTAGAAPVAGYEAKSYARIVTTGQTSVNAETSLRQKIEDVRTFAGQTITVSFWAKAATGTPKIAVELNQDTTGGGNTYAGQVTLSTSWARYSVTVAVPSIAGMTVTASSSLQVRLWVSGGSTYNARTGSIGIQSNTFDIWGVQAEYGSKATPFETATGTIQGELAACQRYYESTLGGATAVTNMVGAPVMATNTGGNIYRALYIPYKVTKRTVPTVTIYDNAAASGKIMTVSSADLSTTSGITGTADNIGVDNYRVYWLTTNGGAAWNHTVSAEL